MDSNGAQTFPFSSKAIDRCTKICILQFSVVELFLRNA
tara:strand:+ start:13159 stop:13272 length:114 start_codon:yes stop_codon:yes gene_type:complete